MTEQTTEEAHEEELREVLLQLHKKARELEHQLLEISRKRDKPEK